MHHRHDNPGSRAFTLIELLAVIAIIMLLASILVPSLAGVRGRVEFSRCKSNLNQIGIAANMFASDDKYGDYPNCWDWVYSQGGGYQTNGAWLEWGRADSVAKGAIRPYIGESHTDVFVCPTFPRVCENNPATPSIKPYVTYDMNEYFRGSKTNGGTWLSFATHRTRLIRPAEEGVFCEEDPWVNTPYASSWMNNMCFGSADFDNKPQGPGGTIRDALASFHMPPNGNLVEGFGNVWFADGHVEKRHPSESKDVMTPLWIKRQLFPNVEF